MKHFPEVHKVQKASPTHNGGHVFRRIKISRTSFEKGHTRNNLVKLFQILTSSFGEDFFWEFLHVRIVQNAPIHQSHVYSRINLLRTSFEKGHPRKIPVKLFQNWTSGFREEDFFRSSYCPYSARSPHSPEPCIWIDQNFANIFKRSPKEHSCEIIFKLD